MTEDKIIPEMIKNWKNKDERKKLKEIELLKLDIEKAKLEKELKQIQGEK